jgi:hypothetical protein
MRQVKFVLAAAAVVLVSTASLQAQTIPSPYDYIETRHSAEAWAGYLNIAGGRAGTAPQSAPFLGGRYAIRLTGPLSGTVGLGLIPTRRTVFEAVRITADSVHLDPVGEADMLIVLGEAGLRFTVTGERTWNGLAPYVGAALGATANLRGRPDFEEDIPADQRVPGGPGLALGLSAGTDWFLTERLSLRGEARNYVWRLVIPEGLSARQFRDSQWTNNLGLSLGAALHF